MEEGTNKVEEIKKEESNIKKKSRGKRLKEKTKETKTDTKKVGIKSQDDKKEKVKSKENKKKVKTNDKEENKTNNTEKNKEENKEKINTKNRIIINIIFTIAIVISIACVIVLYLLLRPKFKDITIELGTKEVNIEDFLVSSIYAGKIESLTDLSTLNLDQVGEIELTFKFCNMEEKVTLSIVDTTPPEVKFQNVVEYLDYEINPEDFIAEKIDLSEMTVELLERPEITEYADYNVTIKVKDKYDNETIGNCILTVTWIRTEVNIELGSSFSIEDLILNVEENGDRVPQSEIDKVDTETVGEYIIKIEDNGKEYTSIVKVQDTTPPELVLRDLSIYDDEKISDYTKFIKKVTDISGEPITNLKTEIDYTKIGEQEIVIEAMDNYGNKVEETAILTIKKDTDGPVFSGLTDITVEKNSTIDYYSGVSAIDKRDGKCEFSVNTSGVNISVAGTYYVTYTAKDTKGNTTIKKREITVKHSQEDTNAKLNEFYNNYCAGKDPVGMASAVREHIKYSSNWGGDDPVWYGLTEGKGNCYVHAMVLNKVLEKAGYTNYIIYLEDNSHYWNLVYVNGVWRHLDGTPSVNHTLGLLTDAQKLADPGVHQKTWDTSKWPAAE